MTIKEDSTRERIAVERKKAAEAIETLGIFLLMDGNNKKQVKYLKKKANEFSSNARPVKVTRFQAKLGLDTTILKTLEYPMEAIDLEKNEWDKIMKPILNCILPKIGVNRKFPRKLVYAPSKLSGLGVIHSFHL